MKLYSTLTKRNFVRLGVCSLVAIMFAFLLASVGFFSGLNARASANTTTFTRSLDGLDDTNIQELEKDVGGAYLINTVDDLRTMAYLVNNGKVDEITGKPYSVANYSLKAYLDLSGFDFWEAIGTIEHPFGGAFEGNGYSLYGLTIIDPKYAANGATAMTEEATDTGLETYYGLFGYVKYDAQEGTPVVIKNLGLKDTLIKTDGYYVGSIAARAEGDATVNHGLVSITECYNTGYIEGSMCVGGLVGLLEQGATITDSYNAPSVSDLARNTGSIQNATYGVCVNASAGSAGGLAGIAADNGVNRIITNCYNASVLGVVTPEGAPAIGTDEVNLGAFVGDKSDVTKNLLSKNFFLKACLPGWTLVQLNKEGGKSTAIGSINPTLLKTTLGFNVDCTTETDLPTNPTGIWLQSSKTNNGLPFLRNTPQITRIDFESRAGDAVINSTDVEAFVQSGNFALKSGNSYFVKPNAVYFESAIAAGTDSDFAYKFNCWEKYDLTKTYYPGSKQGLEIPGGDQKVAVSFPYVDMKLVAMLDEREYSILLSPNATEYVASQVTKVNDEANSVAKFYDKVTFEVTPKSGYKVANAGWQALDGSVAADAQDANKATFDIKKYLRKAYESQPDISKLLQLNATVDFVPESYSISLYTNMPDFAGAIKVLNNDKNEINSGAAVGYQDNIYLVVDTESGIINSKYEFGGWKYQVVDAGLDPSDTNWIDIPSREDSTVFTIPDCLEGQKICIKAIFNKISYSMSLENVDIEGGSIYLCDNMGNKLNNPSNKFAYDEQVFVKIVVNNGYHYDAVVIDGVSYPLSQNQSIGGLADVTWDSVNSIVKFNHLTQNTSVYVEFIKNTYSVNVTLEASNADSTTTKVILTGLGERALGSHTIAYNDAFAFDIVLEDGFTLDDIIANVELAETGKLSRSAVIKGNANIKIIVRKQSFVVTGTFSYAGDYDYKADNSCFVGVGEYLYGSNVQVSVNLPEMFVISQWFLGGVRVDTKNDFLNIINIRENQHIVVELLIKSSFVSFGQVGDTSSGAWYSIHKDQQVYQYINNIEPMKLNYGEFLEFSVNEQYFIEGGRNSQYVFAYWQVNGVSITTDKFLTLTAKGKNLLVEAVFMPAKVKVSAKTYLLNTLTFNMLETSEVGKITGLDTNATYYGEKRSVVANANEGYKFLEWRSEDGELLTSSAVYSFTVSEAETFCAVFVKVNDVILVNDEDKGEITGLGEYVVGDLVTLTAIPAKGYRFISWTESGTPVGTSTTLSFIMPNNDVLLAANFEAIYVVDYSVNNDSLGQIIGNTSGKFKENITLEAVSANNCSFIGWMIDDVIISTSQKLNLSLNGDVRVQALFKKNFDWNIIIILFGAGVFIIVMIYGTIAYIKAKEAQPISARALIGGKDDMDIIKKSSKRVALRDEIAPVPTRRESRANVQPVPVRKIVVAPSDHKGQKVGKAKKASDQKSTLSTNDEE